VRGESSWKLSRRSPRSPTIAALIAVPPISTPIASGSPESALVSLSLTMVCALYRFCAILLGNMAVAEDASAGTMTGSHFNSPK